MSRHQEFDREPQSQLQWLEVLISGLFTFALRCFWQIGCGIVEIVRSIFRHKP